MTERLDVNAEEDFHEVVAFALGDTAAAALAWPKMPPEQRELAGRAIHGFKLEAETLALLLRQLPPADWCLARDIIRISPCTLIEPPASERSRDRILSDDELRLVWTAADADGWPFGPLVKLLILTGQRLSEVTRWDEIDFENKLWTIPPERAKNRTRHEVPLSDAAIGILSSLPRIKTTKGFVFTTQQDAGVSAFSRAKDRLDAAIKAALPKGANGPKHWTFHDLRRTMASGMAGVGIQLPVFEKVLNHTIGTFRGVVGVYQRYNFSDEKRKALDAWASFVQSIVSSRPLENVVKLRGGS